MDKSETLGAPEQRSEGEDGTVTGGPDGVDFVRHEWRSLIGLRRVTTVGLMLQACITALLGFVFLVLMLEDATESDGVLTFVVLVLAVLAGFGVLAVFVGVLLWRLHPPGRRAT